MLLHRSSALRRVGAQACPWLPDPRPSPSRRPRARGHGVTVRTGAPVARILIHDDAVKGVVLESGEEIAASAVLSTPTPREPSSNGSTRSGSILNSCTRGEHPPPGCTAFVVYGSTRFRVFGVRRQRARGLLLTRPRGARRAADRPSTAPYPSGRTSSSRFRRCSARSPRGARAHRARQYAPYRLKDGSWDKLARALAARVDLRSRRSPLPSGPTFSIAVWSPLDLGRGSACARARRRKGWGSTRSSSCARSRLGASRTPISGLYLGGCGTPGPRHPGRPAWPRRRVLDRAGPDDDLDSSEPSARFDPAPIKRVDSAASWYPSGFSARRAGALPDLAGRRGGGSGASRATTSPGVVDVLRGAGIGRHSRISQLPASRGEKSVPGDGNLTGSSVPITVGPTASTEDDGAPRLGKNAVFDHNLFSLKPAAVQAWGPLIFIHLGDTPERSSPARPLAPRLAHRGRRSRVRRAALVRAALQLEDPSTIPRRRLPFRSFTRRWPGGSIGHLSPGC